MDQPDKDSYSPSFWRRPAGMALATAALIAGFTCCESRSHAQTPRRTNNDKE